MIILNLSKPLSVKLLPLNAGGYAYGGLRYFGANCAHFGRMYAVEDCDGSRDHIRALSRTAAKMHVSKWAPLNSRPGPAQIVKFTR